MTGRRRLAEAPGLAPGLAGATLVEVRIGLRPASPDGLPLLGRLPTTANGRRMGSGA